ncbi:MAG: 23S rRNA (pseudouridine(1915)-N(3))-methyltransferase RlmH [Lachnospiraceae bacterium]|nr:23S rRNA (pseudouridine(1915)-N(3))-methyltransferase RlmH [Lachnospiraceae bacterium]
MEIKIICVGKIKESYLSDGISDFTGRIRKAVPIRIIELPDEKTPQGASLLLEEKIRETEGKRILQKIEPNDHVFALCIEGKQLSTEQFSQRIAALKKEGKESIVFVIGGSLGLSREVTDRAQDKISFSAMTFPHQLMRLILTEQLYRVFS